MLPTVTPTELDTFSHGETSQFTTEQKSLVLQQASDLLFIATQYDETPDDARLLRLIKNGLMDMAWSLLVKTENKTEIYSPFSSETIGSYSYSKAFKQASEGTDTGVSWFDSLVRFLGQMGLSGAAALSWISSESIMPPLETGFSSPPSPDSFGW